MGDYITVGNTRDKILKSIDQIRSEFNSQKRIGIIQERLRIIRLIVSMVSSNADFDKMQTYLGIVEAIQKDI